MIQHGGEPSASPETDQVHGFGRAYSIGNRPTEKCRDSRRRRSCGAADPDELQDCTISDIQRGHLLAVPGVVKRAAHLGRGCEELLLAVPASRIPNVVPLRLIPTTMLDPGTSYADISTAFAPAIATLRKNRWLPERNRAASMRRPDSTPSRCGNVLHSRLVVA